MNKSLRIFVLILSFLVTLPSFFISYAQTPVPPSSEGITTNSCGLLKGIVPPANETLPSECADIAGGVSGSCGAVGTQEGWAQKINDKIISGTDAGGNDTANDFDNLSGEVSNGCGKTSPRASWFDNQYWCTYLVVDAYTLAGIQGLSIGSLGTVIAMHKFFQNTNGFTFVEYAHTTDKKAALQKVKPGYVIFMESVYGEQTRREHVAIVKSKEIDSNGFGKIITLEANVLQRSKTLSVVDWNVQGTTYPIAGFGGH